MGLYDRDYSQYNERASYFDRPAGGFSFSRITPVVKWLLIINAGVFVLTVVSPRLAGFAWEWLSVYPLSIGRSLQLWRLITYQFLHDTGGFSHILFNMICLYFLGVMLERTWGSRRFLRFYLICGATGGIVYPLLALVGWLDKAPLVGASGGILGMIAACAILFPNVRVLVFFMFPVRLVIVALVLAAIAVLTLIRPDQFLNAGGEAAHLGGMVAGAAYVLSQSRGTQFWLRIKHRFGRKREISHQNLQVELDNILDKVNRSGIHSLTRREKRVLKQATELERKRNRL